METDSRVRQGPEPIVRELETADRPVLVVDFGPDSSDLTTDIVDDTLIVVDESTDEQHEYSLPGEHRRTFMQNGVLTIEVEG